MTGSTTPVSNQPGSFATDSPVDFYQGFQDYVVGMPHRYLANADPNQRTFTRHMLMTPPLVMIRPGRVQYTNSAGLIAQITSALGASASSADVESIFDVSGGPQGTFFDKAHQYGADPSDLAALNTAISQKFLSAVQDVTAPGAGSEGVPPIRYFEFTPAVDEYMSVLATLSSRLYARMTAWRQSNPLAQLPWLAFDDNEGGAGGPKPEKYGGFITYWADNASSVSESVSSEVGQTAVAAALNGLTNVAHDAQFVFGNAQGGITGALNDVYNGITSTLGWAFGSGDEKASGIPAALGDAILGLNPLFPEVWKNSSFTRTYDISFKFFSPYGAPGAIYQNVLLPFAQLLALVLPVMRSPGAYSEPFVFQADCPGHFSCDLGICTGFTFTKGGPDHLWSKDGLPRQIDVNMQIKDLYPTLMASHNNASLYCNIGLSTFLDNLAGINLFTSTQATSPITLLQAKLQRFLTIAEEAPTTIKAQATNFLFQGTGGQIAALFRGQ
jgi:hypothetical protein